jgi:hypothetical protein
MAIRKLCRLIIPRHLPSEKHCILLRLMVAPSNPNQTPAQVFLQNQDDLILSAPEYIPVANSSPPNTNCIFVNIYVSRSAMSSGMGNSFRIVAGGSLSCLILHSRKEAISVGLLCSIQSLIVDQGFPLVINFRCNRTRFTAIV